MNRANLHALVDTLAEGALENAERVLQPLQTWPPEPPKMEQIGEIQREQIEPMKRIGLGGGGGGSSNRKWSPEIERMREKWQKRVEGGGGSFHPVVGYGYSGRTRWEGDIVVHETYHLYKEHEIVVTERFRFTDDSQAIHYTHEAKGPKGDSVRNQNNFELG